MTMIDGGYMKSRGNLALLACLSILLSACGSSTLAVNYKTLINTQFYDVPRADKIVLEQDPQELLNDSRYVHIGTIDVSSEDKNDNLTDILQKRALEKGGDAVVIGKNSSRLDSRTGRGSCLRYESRTTTGPMVVASSQVSGYTGGAPTVTAIVTSTNRVCAEWSTVPYTVTVYEASANVYRDFSTGIASLKEKALAGDSASQYKLGTIYANGRGVLINYGEAARFYLMAALQDHPDAQNNLGVIFRNGNLGKQDYVNAYAWYMVATQKGSPHAKDNLAWAEKALSLKQIEQGKRIAAQILETHTTPAYPFAKIDFKEGIAALKEKALAGDSASQYKLGVIYEIGRDVPINYGEAARFYLMAALQDHPDAQNNLGVLFHNGNLGQWDYVNAYAWYTVAIQKGSTFARDNLALAEKELSQKQIKRGKRIAAQILESHTAPDSQFDNIDFKTVIASLKEKALAGDSASQYKLGVIYANGRGTPQNYGEAARFYLMAALQDHPDAQNNLGSLFQNGNLGQRDSVNAYAWFTVAIQKGSKLAKNNLALIEKELSKEHIERGKRIVAQILQSHTAPVYQFANIDFKEGIAALKEKALAGDSVSQYALGTYYEFGRGVPQTYGEAARFYLLAALQDHPDAQNDLGALFHNGYLGQRDYVNAYAWFTVAQKGSTLAKSNLALAEKELSLKQIEQGKRIAAQILETHTTPDYPFADIMQ